MATNVCRSKRSYVCDQCYRCKVKCSKERPSCRRCRQANRSCTYSLGLWKGQPRNPDGKCREHVKYKQPELTPPDSNDGEDEHARSMVEFEKRDSVLNGSNQLERPKYDAEPASQTLEDHNLQGLLFPLDPSIEWMEMSTVSPMVQYLERFADDGHHGDSFGHESTSPYGNQLLSSDQTEDDFSLGIEQQADKDRHHPEDVAKNVDDKPGLYSSGVFSPEIDGGDITGISLAGVEVQDRFPRHFYPQERLETPPQPQPSRTESLVPIGFPSSSISRPSSRLRLGQTNQQRLLRRSHPYQNGRSRSHSTDSLKGTRQFGTLRTMSAGITRTMSASPPKTPRLDETMVSSLPTQYRSWTPSNNAPSVTISNSSSPCNCLSSTISSLESLCSPFGELLEWPNEYLLLNYISTALTVCDQIITCCCGRKGWAGLRCLLIIQEIYSHLECILHSTQHSGGSPSQVDGNFPSPTARDSSQQLGTRQPSDTAVIQQVKVEAMRAVMLLAGLELLPENSRPFEDAQARSLKWKDIALDLSLKLRSLLSELSNV